MDTRSYEKHSRKDPNFPITFHPSQYNENSVAFYMHWHEHIEILYFIKGETNITINNSQFFAKKGDIAVVNTNCMHSMLTKPLDCRYHCLIVDKSFFDNFFAPMQDIIFNEIIHDDEINSLLDLVAIEMKQQNSFYKPTVKSYVSLILSIMARRYQSITSELRGETRSQKLNMVKTAISYIGTHYKENITIEDIISYIGFSKYYFCHTFKEITGQTAFDYINVLRCTQAKKLLGTGKYNISESALMSGFNNLSYFTRTYKKHMGVLPSQDV